MGRFLLNKNHLGFAACLWTILSVIVPNLLLAQDPFTRKIAFLEGLPTQTIFDMHFSSSGLLYFGTNKGLISFDGARFEEYGFGNNLGISVHRIQQDDDGTLWCMNFSNQVFYLEENLLKPLPEVDSLFYKSEKNLIDFVITTDGLWLLTEYEMYFMHFSGETELLFSVEKDRVKDYFTGITLDSSGENVYIAAIDKIYHFNRKKLVKTSKSVVGQKEILHHNGEIYFNTKAVGNQAWVLNSGKINTDKVLPGSYYYSLRAVDDELWLLTSNGAYKVDTKNLKVEEGYFKEKRITDILKDLEGNHWLSTLNEGIFMVPSPHLKIVNPTQNTTKKNREL